MPLELHDLNWDIGFGHVQTSLNPWASPQWVPRLVESDSPALPTVYPGDVATAETCFRLPDGWIVCVLRDGLDAIKYRERGYAEVPQSAPDFVPPFTPVSTGQIPPTVVPSTPQTGVSEDATDVAVDWGTIFSGAVDIWQGQQVGGAPQMFAAPMPIAAGTGPGVVATGGSCGCNSNPCVCGTINGRPALVDPRTGKRCYRRRRRVMLTEGDFNTLLRIATLPNNANVRTALAKAIGRR